jgi:permease, yjgP/yjgQ family
MLKEMNADIVAYVQKSNLKSPPNFIRTFFKYQPDHEIEQLSNNLETIIDDLSNTRNKLILSELNKYPVLITKAHTRPFEYKWLNIAAAIILPVGLFLYFRMWGFRLRLYRDLKIIKQTNDNIIEESEKIIAKQKQ